MSVPTGGEQGSPLRAALPVRPRGGRGGGKARGVEGLREAGSGGPCGAGHQGELWRNEGGGGEWVPSEFLGGH